MLKETLCKTWRLLFLRFTWMCKNPPSTTAGRSRIKISIIGAGPGGLAAAGYFACLGYSVTVYDKQPLPGGMMVFAIPKVRIRDETVLEGVYELRDKFGVVFKNNIKIFGDHEPPKEEGEHFVKEIVNLKDIVDESDAVLITTGTWQSRKLRIPGEEGSGVMSAVEYLYDIRVWEKGLVDHKPSVGRKVVIIGAGLSAVDAALEALEQGVEEVMIAYRRTKKQAPAGVYEINKLARRGVKWIELVSPVEIIRENGRVKAIRLQKMRLGEPDESGRPRPIPIPGSEYDLEADTIIEAIGEIPTPPVANGYLGIKLDRRNKIIVDEKFRTGNPKVWAAGDVVTGPSFIGNAIKTALYASKSIHTYLSSKIL
ncbi:FAD-dependent oxidoreductase [Staphylothermus hellenicus]|uniref:FAD-dependent pyridine nucleotide-disulfide oxidoreductase n=1 Tax=Staphylothermus hellenicus (strain DSM 12710 / JCM 10830 / BK20S6-10-b1 / P8) TaxID=591019 RepID=D7D9Q1_STAHD|nr:FAD-dependent oxidoreductase [Staphylothermus hellenicus]ADI32497.1 FAD-dependent pyridine nucleotide-disulfide oxidoreductase [Staphylothermus hellenicus DSM 12710]